MNPAYGITPENLLRILPDVLKNDESMLALANAIIGVLAGQPDDIEEVMIYTRIDKLPEPLLDILAYDFKVDWWDANYTLAEKRRVLKESWAVRRRLGTKAAVQRAVSAIFDDTLVQEWFEYGGQPFYFRVLSTNAAIASESLDDFMFILNLTKRNSAWLDGIYLSLPWHLNIYAGFGLLDAAFETHRMGGI